MVMDPLSALGLASNIVQLTDFGIRIVDLCHDFYKAHGDLPSDFARIESLAVDLLPLAQRLEQQTQASTSSVVAEPTFQALIDGTLIKIKKLHDLLSSLKSPGNRIDPLNLRTAFRALCKTGEINKLVAELEQYRDAISARLVHETHEKQQFLCEVVDKSRTENHQSSRAIQDALDTLKISISQSSHTLATDVNALVTQGNESNTKLRQLLDDIRLLSDHVESMTRRARTTQLLHQPIRTPAIFQLQSARQHRRVRMRSNSDQALLSRTPRPLRAHKQSSERKGPSSRSEQPVLDFTISVTVYGDPRDLVSLLRNLLFTSWTNVIQPVVALLSPNTIPSHPSSPRTGGMEIVNTMLAQGEMQIHAEFDASTGMITISTKQGETVLRTRLSTTNYHPTEKTFFVDYLPWGLSESLPHLDIDGLNQELHVIRSASTAAPDPIIELDSPDFVYFLDQAQATHSLPSPPSETPLTFNSATLFDVQNEELGNELIATESTAIDFSEHSPNGLPVMKESSIYAQNMFSGNVYRHSKRQSCSSRPDSTMHPRSSRSQHSSRNQNISCWFKRLLRLMCFLILGWAIDKLGVFPKFDSLGISDNAVVRDWMYGRAEGEFWLYKPAQENVEHKATEEARLIREDRQKQARHAHEKKMRERAFRCNSGGGCTRKYWDELWQKDRETGKKGYY